MVPHIFQFRDWESLKASSLFLRERQKVFMIAGKKGETETGRKSLVSCFPCKFSPRDQSGGAPTRRRKKGTSTGPALPFKLIYLSFSASGSPFSLFTDLKSPLTI